MFVKSLEELSQVVVRVEWVKIGVDTDGSIGSFMSVTSFDLSTVNPDEFIPFSELTEDVVVGWIKAGISEDSMSRIDQQIQKVADYNKNPEVNATLPWLPVPQPIVP